MVLENKIEKMTQFLSKFGIESLAITIGLSWGFKVCKQVLWLVTIALICCGYYSQGFLSTSNYLGHCGAN